VIISVSCLLVRCLLGCLTVLSRGQVSKDAERSAGNRSSGDSPASTTSPPYHPTLPRKAQVATRIIFPSLTGCSNYNFSFWLHINTAETTTTTAYDKLTVQVLNSSGTFLSTLHTYSNLNRNTGYARHSFSLSGYAGQMITLKFTGRPSRSALKRCQYASRQNCL
jgi:hypothetical protein